MPSAWYCDKSCVAAASCLGVNFFISGPVRTPKNLFPTSLTLSLRVLSSVGVTVSSSPSPVIPVIPVPPAEGGA